MAPSIILASESMVRRRLLDQAGITYTTQSSGVDETPIKKSCQEQNLSASDTAERLAEAKAQSVSRLHPDALVIGADQMLDHEGRWFDKPTDIDNARRHLIALRGRTHHLVSATVVLAAGQCVWKHQETIDMKMRALSDTFIEDYLSQVGASAFISVGAYQLEGLGAQLFEDVDGDFFSILGLPLLPLLGFLRQREAIGA